MRAQHSRTRKGRPRRPAPQALPDDLYNYGDDPTLPARQRRQSPDGFDIEALPVFDDWPNEVPVTDAEVDIFERYFGDVLDRLFGPADDDPGDEGLPKLTSDGNNSGE